MPSFDIVCEPNAVELKNAVDTANKEIANRFDFKGSDARIELKEKEHEIYVYADDDFKLGQVRDVLYGKMAKRNVDTRYLKAEDPEKIGGDKVKQKMVVKNGVESELAKKIVKMLKDAKLKVTASIQGDVVRVTSAKKDELQTAIQEIERVGANKYIMLESYRNELEQFNLQCWALTAESFFDTAEWIWLYNHFGYTGDYEFIYFE